MKKIKVSLAMVLCLTSLALCAAQAQPPGGGNCTKSGNKPSGNAGGGSTTSGGTTSGYGTPGSTGATGGKKPSGNAGGAGGNKPSGNTNGTTGSTGSAGGNKPSGDTGGSNCNHGANKPDGNTGGPTQPPTQNSYAGNVTAVDLTASTITLTNSTGSLTATVNSGTQIAVDCKAAKLADVKVGMNGCVKLATDGVTALAVKADTVGGKGGDQTLGFDGQITAVDMLGSTVTFTNNKEGGTLVATFNAGTKVQIGPAKAAPADLKPGMFGGVKLAADGSTALGIKVDPPRPQSS